MPEIRIALGLGCDRNTPLETLQQAIDQALAQSGHTRAQVAAVASITLKADEACMQQLAALQGWPMRFFTPPQLAAVPVPNPSDTVRRYTGTPSVSEAAALLGAPPDDLAGWLQTLVDDFGLPRLGAFGVGEQHLEELARKAARASSMRANPIELSEQELRRLVRAAL